MNPPTKSRKLDWDNFLKVISHRKIIAFYHYTPLKNLPQILNASGIYSRHQARLRDIKPAEIHGWGDKWKELEDYICLSLVKPTWLLEKSKEPFIALAIKPEVAGYKGTVFSNRSSASIQVDAGILKSQETLDEFDSLFKDEPGNIPRYPLSEILVEDFIPLRDVLAIYLSSWKGNTPYFWFWLYKKWSSLFRYGFSYPPLLVEPKKKLF
jgi:hypothetical protein